MRTLARTALVLLLVRERDDSCRRSAVSRGRARLLDRVAARRRQPSAVPHRMVVSHRLGRDARAASRSASRSRSSAIARVSTKTIRRASSRGRCCSRTPRSAIRGAARCCVPRSPRVRASAWPKRPKARSRSRSTTGRCARTASATLAVAIDERVRVAAGMRSRAAAAAERQERLQSERSAAAVRELLLQPAATADQRPHRDRRPGAARARRRVVRPRMVERMFDEQARGWDWIGLNLDDGGALMVQRIRDDAGKQYWGGATLREPGKPDRVFAPDEIAWSPLRRWRSSRTGVDVSRRMENRSGRAHDTAAPLAGRSGERCAREHRDALLGRRGARVRRARPGNRPRLSRADRLRRATEILTIRSALHVTPLPGRTPRAAAAVRHRAAGGPAGAGDLSHAHHAGGSRVHRASRHVLPRDRGRGGPAELLVQGRRSGIRARARREHAGVSELRRQRHVPVVRQHAHESARRACCSSTSRRASAFA